jgi:hypothetical protein
MNLFEYFTTDNISGKKSNANWLKKNNESLYYDIINWCNEYDILKNIEFKRKIYHYIFNMQEIPVCKNCKDSVKYSRLKDGYRKYCSDKCVKNSPEYYEKWLDSFSKTIKSGNHIKKRKESCESKYGKDFYKIIQESREKNNLKKYGYQNVFQLKEIKEIRKNRLKEKYGDDTYNNPDKTRNTRIKNGTQINEDMIDDFIKYKKLVINRTITVYRNNQNMINPNNLKRSKKSYHIDHLFSIKQGYINNLPIEILSHPCNLHMIYYKENLIKQDNCWITLEELLLKIINFKEEILFKQKHLKYKFSDVKIVSESLYRIIKS